jgi:AraC-like DNA-binding protein
MADPTLEVYTPRKRGRPRARDPLAPVTIWISAREHARIAQLADRRGASVSATARILLKAISDRRG